MLKKYLKYIQISISLIFIVAVLLNSGLFSQQGRDEFVQLFKGSDYFYLFASLLVGILINMCSAMKWYFLTKVRALGAGYWRIFSYYLIGQFYNMFLPTSVGGDVVRSYQLGKFSGQQAEALASVFVERYTGVIVLLFAAFFAILAKAALFSELFVVVCLVLFAIGLSLIAWLIYDNRVYRYCKNALNKKWGKSRILFDKLDKLIASIDVYKTEHTALFFALLNSLLFYFIAVINVYVTTKVFHLDVDFIDMLIATPIIMLIMNIPFSFGNIGLMEFAYSSIFALFGYSPTLGLSVAILMRIKSLFDALIGAVLSPVFVTK